MFRILLTIMMAVMAGASHGSVPDLYTGFVPVEGTGEAERQQAIPSAFIHVLQKLSGLRDLPATEELDRVLAESPGMAVAFYHDNRQRLMPDGSSLEETFLVVNFLPEATDRALREAGLPRWRTGRPPVTFWMVLDDGRGRRLMPVEYAYAWDAMGWVAEQRGFPIRWPDIEPGAPSPVNLQLLWGGFTDQLPEATGMSGGQVIVTGRRAGPHWQVRWVYDNGVERLNWDSEYQDLTFALTDGLHRLTDIVAARDSIRSLSDRLWTHQIFVRGLDGPEAYARCLNYLQSLSLVERVAVATASPGQVGFSMELNAEPSYLREFIIRDKVLEPGAEQSTYRLSR
ncbi:MAG: DUF2066 domain-containing protein [Gammaproteobacteria bacterium]|nr:DUF2066 domain-containing protein [Gammaproteobacteria bacterium]